MTCKKCGSFIEPMHKYCPKCGSKYQSETKKIPTFKIPKTFYKNKLFLVILLSFLIIATILYLYLKFGLPNLSLQSVKYTKNPTAKNIPIESVVKIIVNKGTDEEASGSGLMFTEDGYILTNAHVVSSKLGKPLKEIEVCYLNSGKQETNCEYTASVIDSDLYKDLAVIKTNKPIREINPYLLVVEEDNEIFAEEILEIGSEITSVGYPDVSNGSINITKGIVSGYENEIVPFYDGSLHKLPHYIRTDAEINAGNSGGAAFDNNNRYVGIPSSIQLGSFGKLGYIIYWQDINKYLKNLVYSGDLELNNKQYKEKKHNKSESELYEGIKAIARKDYKNAEDKLKNYSQNNKKDTRAWHALCSIYSELEKYEELSNCAENLRAAGNESALSLSWSYTAEANTFKETPDYTKAYEDINKALSNNLEVPYFMNFKSLIALHLNKTEEAERINQEVKKNNARDSFAWWISGVISESLDKTEEAIENYETSFLLYPDVEIASSLADLYSLTDNPLKELEYIVASLILGSNNPDRLFALSDMISGHFTNYTNDESYITYLDEIKLVFDKLKIDRSLIEPIEKISDEDLKKYIIDLGIVSEVSQEKLNDYKFFINMYSSWLYSVIEDKDMCAKFKFNKNSGEEIIKIHERVGFTTEEAINNISFGLYMSCFCKLDDDSNDLVDKCQKEEVSLLCQEGKILAGNGKCLTPEEACTLDFGGNTYAKDGLCYCADGYDWNSSGTKCVAMCPINSYYSNDGYCNCNYGYRWSGDKCITNEKYCDNTYGFNSYWFNNDCQCNNEWKYYDWWGGLYCSIY